ncbi:MAG: GreA/GreB family elongation factor [Chloroflexota bacterium]|nr:GreA/GreB family elongation factor [Chloroflexota bacterium]
MVRARTVRLTAGGKARLEEELEALLTRRRPDLAARMKEATRHGDVSDSSEHEDLKEEWAIVEARIRDLEQTLERAEVIQRNAADDAVGLGSRVTLRGDDGEEETWVLVSPEEANSLDGTISTESPVGRALLGCRTGDSPSVTTPGGTMVYTVVSVA